MPTQTDLRILFQRSGNRCAFPGCNNQLDFPANQQDGAVVLSEVCHIVSRAKHGPRFDDALPMEERDKYENLILLCREHHTIVDRQPATYTAERLREIKSKHEQLLSEAIEKAIGIQNNDGEVAYVTEVLHSTLLPVLEMPRYVYSIDTDYNDRQEKEVSEGLQRPKDGREIYPFLIRGGQLLCFNDLKKREGPFQHLVGFRSVKRHHSEDWWDDPIKLPWFMTLLNRSLNKLTGRKGLNLDWDHHRYYFMPDSPGEPLSIKYKPLNQSRTERNVVWQPITRKTQMPKPYWYHLAVALNFQRVQERNWCLSIRPEMHVTSDGSRSLPAERIGSKVTRRKSRMFNFDLLSEVQFWRDFLSDSKPRIVLRYGGRQRLIIGTTLLQGTVQWPGMPEKYQQQFRNVEYEEDLFTSAELRELNADDEEWDDLEKDDAWEDEDEGVNG